MAEFMFPNVAYRATVYRTGWFTKKIFPPAEETCIYNIYIPISTSNSKYCQIRNQIKKKKKTFWMHTKKRIRNSRDLILCIVLICSCWSNTLDWQWDQMISERLFCCPVQNDLVNDQIFWDNQIIFRPILGQVLSSFFINQHSQSLYNIQSYVVD